MLSPLRNRFGIPGVISVIALVFAMLGGAYAASNSSDGGKATASAKAKKGPRGPKGATGPAGPAGPAGPQGPAGANGKDGSNGADGKAGTNGTNGAPGAPGAPGASGKSVTITEVPVDEVDCDELGGALVEVAGSGTPVEVCNGENGEDGKEGPAGPEGKPWTAGGILPPGATETGVWSYTGGVQKFTVEVEGNKEEITVGDTEGIRIPISFAIPLKEPLPEEKVHFQFQENFGTFCHGTPSLPSAEPGELCVYSTNSKLNNATFVEIRRPGGAKGAGKTGAAMTVEITGNPAFGSGAWAVTGF